MPTGASRRSELLARVERQTLAVLETLDELDEAIDVGATLTADELEQLGRRLASIGAAGLRVLEHDVARELETPPRLRRRRAPETLAVLLAGLIGAGAAIGAPWTGVPDLDDAPGSVAGSAD